MKETKNKAIEIKHLVGQLNVKIMFCDGCHLAYHSQQKTTAKSLPAIRQAVLDALQEVLQSSSIDSRQ